MSNSDRRAELVRWMNHVNVSVAALEEDRKSVAKLVSSAEEEFRRACQRLALTKIAVNGEQVREPVASSDDTHDQFSIKLRHPDSLRHGWWSVLGLDR